MERLKSLLKIPQNGLLNELISPQQTTKELSSQNCAPQTQT